MERGNLSSELPTEPKRGLVVHRLPWAMLRGTRCHRQASFLFFNGNTFADIARQIIAAIFADLPTGRRREISSAVALHVAGVLDRDSMVHVMEELCESASFQPGDRVKTLRGSTCGVVVRLLPDGRAVWKPDGSPSELVALPESLLKEKSKLDFLTCSPQPMRIR